MDAAPHRNWPATFKNFEPICVICNENASLNIAVCIKQIHVKKLKKKKETNENKLNKAAT